MTSIAHELARILPTLRRHGNFYAAGTSETIQPNLEIDGVGRISLPLLPAQAEQLIAIAARAPFGRGEETIIDTKVRRTWQIGPDRVHLSGRHWPNTMDAIVAKAAAGLGVTEPVSAELYKLLIYDAGSFFVEHRDTEKSDGMFATLVVVLPSVCSGGELIVRHRGHEVCLDLNCADPADVSFAAFYADCVHEVRPVTSGYRLTLVYNLVRKEKGQMLTLPVYEEEQAAITALLRHWVANKNVPGDASPEKLIYSLEHAYTSAELAFATLKNADAAAAAVLVAAAEEADCELHLALVSIEESGSAEQVYPTSHGRRSYSRYDEDDEENFEVDEVHDRTLTVSDWRLPDGSQPAIAALPFIDDELCPPDTFEDMEPDQQYFHEATGNEGASFERTYRRAALVLWPRTHKLAVLNQAGLQLTLPYLADLASRWVDSGEGIESSLWRDAHVLSGYMLRDWTGLRGVSSMYSSAGTASKTSTMLSSLGQLHDTGRIDDFLASISAAGTYSGADNEALVRAAGILFPDRAAELIAQIIARNAPMKAGACASLLVHACADAAFSNRQTLLYPAATVLAETLMGERAGLPPADQWLRPAPIGPTVIDDLLTALCQISAAPLAERVAEHVLANPTSFDMDAILVPAVLGLTERAQTKNSASVRRLRTACLTHLGVRIAEPLEPPADFARPCTIACKCADCTELGNFLADSSRKEWTFKAVEAHRKHVEISIRHNGCDLDFVTLKRGSPYSLACTKNQASHEKRVRQRKSDLDYLARLD